ncbi:outer membrane protein assembly factor [Blastomonas marina]|uniref:Outer membrane protein assembly factor n=1 Tax=Blastomonas marina TaxID=1867408 RepID=A0ABQ1FFZ7_9SPHN|nr:BamA/TamA family outer membrane protein [Blastomonas marina]GGA08433.1 outer membrane protein assembly factor [Blastomonas marina]
MARPFTRTPDRFRTNWLAAALFALGFAATPLQAQDRDTEDELEALIPDSAIDNPEEWAEAEESGEEIDGERVDPEAPLPEMDLSVEWPEPPFELARPDPIEPDPELAAAFEEAQADTIVEPLVASGEEFAINDTLTLVFPTGGDRFPEGTEFLERFRALSSIVELDSDDSTIAQLNARAANDRELLDDLLRIYGYYDAQIFRTVAAAPIGDPAGEGARIRFDIVPGQQYLFGAIDLGDLAETGSDYPHLRASFGVRREDSSDEITPREERRLRDGLVSIDELDPLEVGDAVKSDDIVYAVAGLTYELGESGYAFADVGEPSLLIDHERVEGDLTVPVAPGGKYNFAGVNSNREDFLSSRHLQRIARFDPGELYMRSDVQDLRQAILATGLVSSVTVTPRETTAPQGEAPGEVVLDVEMTEAPLRTWAGAIGYDSQDGFRLEGSWEHRNLFPPEGMLRVRGVVGTREQLAGVVFRKNNFMGRDQVLSVDLYGTTIKRDAFVATTAALLARFEKETTLLFQKPWYWSVGFEAVATSEREGSLTGPTMAPRETYFVAALPLSATLDSSDNLLDPTTGFRLSAFVSPETSRNNDVQSNYARVWLDGRAYFSLSDNIVLAGRAKFGSIPGADIQSIAPSRRFYAGGANSVRGYGYQRIGPRDMLGEPSGGRSLTEINLEARIGTPLFSGALSVVPFVDAGSVDRGATPDFSDIRIGAGVGVRYETNFGPIRVDVGVPLNRREGDSPVAVYVGLGQAF